MGGIDEETRFYLPWRWTYNGKIVHFDDALNNNDFWQVAQAISEVLPERDKDKQMIQSFLYGKESYGKFQAQRELKVKIETSSFIRADTKDFRRVEAVHTPVEGVEIYHRTTRKALRAGMNWL